MRLRFIVATLTRSGLLTSGSPVRIAAQLGAVRGWGLTLAGELRQPPPWDPDRIAIVDERRGEISYAELLHRCEQLARSLHGGYGIGPGDRIGILCRNTTA